MGVKEEERVLSSLCTQFFILEGSETCLFGKVSRAADGMFWNNTNKGVVQTTQTQHFQIIPFCPLHFPFKSSTISLSSSTSSLSFELSPLSFLFADNSAAFSETKLVISSAGECREADVLLSSAS